VTAVLVPWSARAYIAGAWSVGHVTNSRRRISLQQLSDIKEQASNALAAQVEYTGCIAK
jgi:hypothetical protein